MNKIVMPKVTKIWSTPNPRLAVALAGRVCYSSLPVERLMEKLDDEAITKMVTMLLEHRHTSTFRHASYMVAVSGVSRAFSHQLVRHTAGNAYEQRSQHYRTEKDFNVVLPESTPNDMIFEYMEVMAEDQNFYERLLAAGMPKEDARMVLPNATETVLVWTFNLEAALNLCRARSCRLNNYEILAVSNQVRRMIIADFPEMKSFLGPTCWTQGICYEGDKYHIECNKPWRDAVLWSERFPTEIETISVDRNKCATVDMTNVIKKI